MTQWLSDKDQVLEIWPHERLRTRNVTGLAGAAPPPPHLPIRPFKLLGILDVENIPCARDSVLYGSLGSVVAGLGHFLLTSRIRRSCDVGVGGFILVTLGCWFHCRYNYAKLRIQERIARDGIKNQILYESTHLDPERKQSKSGS
uniref:Cytochrome c oxidase assembly protein COX20, mitochondrial n=1 Tax=Neovison vison TaxID=452646 RepID=A0A8C7ADP2_NEOVI